ncbi:hypothetical protein [Geopsychrobacter electrodiphilus]|uniref:hypothetical protein n=1 Tax=Geopsychrobacter electrodiphilus TaxID=225196 RepID=UPI0003775B4E|nr:hypothetical protein [Geopsychrobacter electrodiphilus]
MKYLSRLIKKLICLFKGHDFGDCVYISPSYLTFCRCCGVEIQGRSFDDLEPLTDEDREHLEFIDDWDWDDAERSLPFTPALARETTAADAQRLETEIMALNERCKTFNPCQADPVRISERGSKGDPL